MTTEAPQWSAWSGEALASAERSALAGLVLLTRDATRYRTYFPGLELVAP